MTSIDRFVTEASHGDAEEVNDGNSDTRSTLGADDGHYCAIVSSEIDVMFVITSGASTIFLNPIAEELVERGHRVAIVANFDDGGAGIPVRSSAVRSISLPFRRRPSPARDVAHLFALLRLVSSVRPKVLHVSTPKAGLLGVLAGRMARHPVVIYQARGYRAEGATGLGGLVQRAMERMTCGLAHRVIVNSKSLRDVMIESGVLRPGAGLVVGSGGSVGVDTSSFVPAHDTTAVAAGRRFTIGYVGRIHPDKGIDSLMAAFTAVKLVRDDARLLIVGGRDESQGVDPNDVLGDPTSKVGPEDVEITGFVPDVVPHLQRMDVMVFPSAREGLPNAPLEAQACEVPVVAYRVTGVVDAVVDGVGGVLVEFGDREALTAAVVDLASNPERRLQMGRAGRRFVTDNFERSTVIASNVRFIESMMDATNA